MKMKHFLLFAATVLLAAGVYAADKLAIAEPVPKGGIQPQEIEAFWGILESTFHSDEYRLISRGALKQMLTEIGLTTSSDLVNLNSAQKAKLGQLETVKYILVSEIGRFGSGLNCTLRIIDASTGEIDQARTENLRVRNLDELADRIEPAWKRLLAGQRDLKRSAILAPILQVERPPAYLPHDFNVRMEYCLINRGLKLQNLQTVAKILKRNGLDELFELEPKMYMRIGRLLEVQYLLQATISRFEIAQIPYAVEETGAHGFRYIGNIEGSIRIISAQDGGLVASIPFEERVNFRGLNREKTRDWTVDDYGKFMIKTVIPEKILPELLRVPELQVK